MANETMNFNLPKEQSSIIKVIGVGGGGSNAVNHMYKQGIRGVDFVVCNTDQQALDMSPVPKKIALGASLTEGRGAGAQAEVGRNAAIENLDDIKEVLENNTKMIFITAGMGGGTGTGAAPVIAEAARELGILTVAIVTIPFSFEGRKRKEQAEKGLEELKKHVDTVLVICNDKLREMCGNLKLSDAFNQADDVLSIGAKGIAEIITVEGYVNVDFEDVRTVMTNSGVAIMGSATTSGEDRAIKAVQQALSSPLLNDNNIYGASNILLYINSGKDEVTMDEVSEITDFIQEEAGSEADVIWGNGTDEDLDDKLSITVIATGFHGDKREKLEGHENVKRIELYGNRKANAPLTSRPKETLPNGLTTKPVLFNSNVKNLTLERDVESDASAQSDPSTETSQTPEDSDPIIIHTLDDKPTEVLGYRITEDDEELNTLVNQAAPEMIGVPKGQELPRFDDDDDDDDDDHGPDNSEIEELNPNPVNKVSVEMPDSKEEASQEALFEAEELPSAETPTEVEFVINAEKEDEPEPEVKRYDLFGDSDAAEVPKEKDDTDEEPKLITRDKPFKDDQMAEEMQKKQVERFERLKTLNVDYNSPSNLIELENVPAFRRRKVKLENPPHSSESSVSRLGLKPGQEKEQDGEKKSGLSSSNPYLHESVD